MRRQFKRWPKSWSYKPHKREVRFVNDNLLSVLADVAANLERVAEALEAQNEKQKAAQ